MFNTVVSASLGSCIEVIHSIFTDEVCCVSHHTRLHAIAVRHSILAVFTLGTRLRPPRAHERSASAQDEPRALGYYVRSMVWSRHTVCEKDEVLHQYFSFLSAKTLERMAADIHVLLLLKKKRKKVYSRPNFMLSADCMVIITRIGRNLFTVVLVTIVICCQLDLCPVVAYRYTQAVIAFQCQS